MSNALFGGSFDPYTVGHHAVWNAADRTLGKDKILLTIAQNPGKADKNVHLVKWRANPAFPKFESDLITVATDPMLADYATNQNCDVLVRSMRNPIDLAQEIAMADLNKEYGMDTVFVPGESKYSHVSSSAVNALRALHKNVHKFFVNDMQHARYLNVKPKRIIVVGNMGSGKSSFIKDHLSQKMHCMDMDSEVKDYLSTEASEYFKKFFAETELDNIENLWYNASCTVAGEELYKYQQEVSEIILKRMSVWEKLATECFEVSAFTCYEDLEALYVDSIIVYVAEYESEVPKQRTISPEFLAKVDALKQDPTVVDFVIDPKVEDVETTVSNIIKTLKG